MRPELLIEVTRMEDGSLLTGCEQVRASAVGVPDFEVRVLELAL